MPSLIRRARLVTTAAAFLSGISLAMTGGVAAAATNPVSAIALPVPLAAGPIPAGVASNVSCQSVGNCTAVGQYQDTIGITHAMALNEVGGNWSATTILA